MDPKPKDLQFRILCNRLMNLSAGWSLRGLPSTPKQKKNKYTFATKCAQFAFGAPTPHVGSDGCLFGAPSPHFGLDVYLFLDILCMSKLVLICRARAKLTFVKSLLIILPIPVILSIFAAAGNVAGIKTRVYEDSNLCVS